MARLIDANDFLRRLTLDTSKGHYGEFMDGSEVAYTSREIEVALNEVSTITPPNEPLTLDELRKMDEPVWCACNPIEGRDGYWCLCLHGYITTPGGRFFEVGEIPHWIFYRRPPEGEEA